MSPARSPTDEETEALHQRAQAVLELEEAHRLSPNDKQTTVALARAYLQNKEPEKARDLVRPIHDSGSSDIPISTAYFQACREIGDIKGAAKVAYDVIGRFPQDIGIRVQLINLYKEADRPGPAVRAARAARRAIRNDISLRITLIDLCLDNDREEEAYREAMDIGRAMKTGLIPATTKLRPEQVGIITTALNYKPQNG